MDVLMEAFWGEPCKICIPEEPGKITLTDLLSVAEEG